MSLCYNHSVNYKKKILHSREAFQYCHWPTLFLYISHILLILSLSIFLKYFYDKDEINNISDTCKYNVANRGCIGEPLASSKKTMFFSLYAVITSQRHHRFFAYIYYQYIEREKEKEKEKVCVLYMYIHIQHIHTQVYLYIYIYIEREREKESAQARACFKVKV